MKSDLNTLIKTMKIYITQFKEISSTDLKLVDDVHSPTYFHSVLTDKDLKMVYRGIKNKPQIMLEKLFKDEKFDLDKGRNGVVYASGNSNAPGTSINFTYGRPDNIPNTKNIALSVSNVLAGLQIYNLGKFEYLSTDSTACISGAAALTQAYNMIKWGQLDRVLVISCDEGSSYDMLEFFTKYRVCNTVDEDRGTFFLGEGASYILLESEDVAKDKSIEVISAVTYHENYSNAMGISESGEGYTEVIKRSSREYKIDNVKMHGTGTDDNEIEETIVNDLLGSVNKLYYKRDIGHTLGSNATIEMIKAINDTDDNSTTMHLAAGMGNVFSSVVTRNVGSV